MFNPCNNTNVQNPTVWSQFFSTRYCLLGRHTGFGPSVFSTCIQSGSQASCLEEVSEGTSLYVRVQIGAEKQKRVTKLSLDSAFTFTDISSGEFLNVGFQVATDTGDVLGTLALPLGDFLAPEKLGREDRARHSFENGKGELEIAISCQYSGPKVETKKRSHHSREKNKDFISSRSEERLIVPTLPEDFSKIEQALKLLSLNFEETPDASAPDRSRKRSREKPREKADDRDRSHRSKSRHKSRSSSRSKSRSKSRSSSRKRGRKMNRRSWGRGKPREADSGGEVESRESQGDLFSRSSSSSLISQALDLLHGMPSEEAISEALVMLADMEGDDEKTRLAKRDSLHELRALVRKTSQDSLKSKSILLGATSPELKLSMALARLRSVDEEEPPDLKSLPRATHHTMRESTRKRVEKRSMSTANVRESGRPMPQEEYNLASGGDARITANKRPATRSHFRSSEKERDKRPEKVEKEEQVDKRESKKGESGKKAAKEKLKSRDKSKSKGDTESEKKEEKEVKGEDKKEEGKEEKGLAPRAENGDNSRRYSRSTHHERTKSEGSNKKSSKIRRPFKNGTRTISMKEIEPESLALSPPIFLQAEKTANESRNSAHSHTREKSHHRSRTMHSFSTNSDTLPRSRTSKGKGVPSGASLEKAMSRSLGPPENPHVISLDYHTDSSESTETADIPKLKTEPRSKLRKAHKQKPMTQSEPSSKGEKRRRKSTQSDTLADSPEHERERRERPKSDKGTRTPKKIDAAVGSQTNSSSASDSYEKASPGPKKSTKRRTPKTTKGTDELSKLKPTKEKHVTEQRQANALTAIGKMRPTDIAIDAPGMEFPFSEDRRSPPNSNVPSNVSDFASNAISPNTGVVATLSANSSDTLPSSPKQAQCTSVQGQVYSDSIITTASEQSLVTELVETSTETAGTSTTPPSDISITSSSVITQATAMTSEFTPETSQELETTVTPEGLNADALPEISETGVSERTTSIMLPLNSEILEDNVSEDFHEVSGEPLAASREMPVTDSDSLADSKRSGNDTTETSTELVIAEDKWEAEEDATSQLKAAYNKVLSVAQTSHVWLRVKNCLETLLEARMLLKEAVEYKVRIFRETTGTLLPSEIHQLIHENRSLFNYRKNNRNNSTQVLKEITKHRKNILDLMYDNTKRQHTRSELEQRIGLLLNHKVSLHELDVKRRKKQSFTISMQKVDKDQMEVYANLFYLLQSEPQYIVKLLYHVQPSELPEFLQTVFLALYGYCDTLRTEYLTLSLFHLYLKSLMGSLSTPLDIIAELTEEGKPLDRLMDEYRQSQKVQSYCVAALARPITSLLSRKREDITDDENTVTKRETSSTFSLTDNESKLDPPRDKGKDREREVTEELPSAMQSMALDAIFETEASSTDETEFVSETEIIDKLENLHSFDLDNVDGEVREHVLLSPELDGKATTCLPSSLNAAHHPLYSSPNSTTTNIDNGNTRKGFSDGMATTRKGPPNPISEPDRRAIPVYLRDYAKYFPAEFSSNHIGFPNLYEETNVSGSESISDGDEKERKTSVSHSSWWSWGSENASESDNSRKQEMTTGKALPRRQRPSTSVPTSDTPAVKEAEIKTDGAEKRSDFRRDTAGGSTDGVSHSELETPRRSRLSDLQKIIYRSRDDKYEEEPDRKEGKEGKDRDKKELIQTQVIPILDSFVDSIISADSSLPYIARSICSETARLILDNFPKSTEEEILKIVGTIIYFKILDPILVNPVSLGIHYPNSVREQKKLVKISKILKGLFRFEIFPSRSQLSMFNPWIRKNREKMMEYFFDTIICDLTPAEKVLGISAYTKYYFDFQPTLFVGLYNISLVHRLLLAHGDKLIEGGESESDGEKVEKSKEREKETERREREEGVGGHKAMAGILELLKTMPVHSVAKEGSQEVVLRLDNTKVSGQSFEHIPKENEERELEETTKELILHMLKVVPRECIRGRTFIQIINSSEEFAEKTEDKELKKLVQTVSSNLEKMEKCSLISSSDNYESFFRKLCIDVVYRIEKQEEQRQELELLNLSEKDLADHKKFLDQVISDLETYLEAVRDNFKPKNSGKAKKWRYDKLLKRSIVAHTPHSAIPKSITKKLRIGIAMPKLGYFNIIAYIAGTPSQQDPHHFTLEEILMFKERKTELSLTLHGSDEKISLNPEPLILLLNKQFLV